MKLFETLSRDGFVLGLCSLALCSASLAVVPPHDPELDLPDSVRLEIKDDREGAFSPLYPLGGVVSGNLSKRRSAGPLTLEVLAGSYSYPVLPGKYSDSGADPFSPTAIQNRLFQSGYTQGGRPGSLRDYFNEVSYGNYLIDGTVEPWVTVSQSESFYLGATDCSGLCRSTTESAAGFVKEVIDLNDAGVDFSLFDNDGPDGVANSGDDDGVVDLLVVLRAASGAECGGSGIWSHLDNYSSTFGGAYSTNDVAFSGAQITIEDYIVIPVYECDGTSMFEIGTAAYLFGSHLGWPALWDRDLSSRGAGVWALMGRGYLGGDGNSLERPTHPSAYSKSLAGWIQPDVVTTFLANASIPSASTTAHAREWRRPPTCTHDEYFLVENRQNAGFDLGLPGNSLLIWNVDDRQTSSDDEARPRLHLLAADNRYGLQNGVNDGDTADPWPGSTGRPSWRDVTEPSSARHFDRLSGASINTISLSGDPMTADLNQDLGLLMDLNEVIIDDALDGSGDNDGVIDPYETVRLRLRLSNESQSQVTGISGTLSLLSPVPGVTITGADATWPDLDPCGIGELGDFEIYVDETVACDTTLDFRLSLTTDSGTLTFDFSEKVGSFFAEGGPADITTSNVDTGKPRSTVAGNEYAVVYHEQVGGLDLVRLERIDEAHTLLGTSDISAGTGNSRNPDVFWNGSEYAVAWEDDRDGTSEIYFARVDASGTRIGAELRLTNSSGIGKRPRIAWNDTDSEWGIVWTESTAGDDDVLFARVDAAGTKVGGDIAVATGAGSQSAPDVFWNGDRYGIVWQDDSLGEWTMFFIPLDAGGAAIAPTRRIETLPGDSRSPAITWNPSTLLFGVAYVDNEDARERTGIKTVRVPPDGSVPPAPKPLSSAGIRAEAPDTDCDGVSFFVSWIDFRDGKRTVRLTRTDERHNVIVDGLIMDDDPRFADSTSLSYGSGRLVASWRRENAAGNRFDAAARISFGAFECGRDDDRDGVLQPGDNCPNTPNVDQADNDNDNWGDACDCDDIDPKVNPGTPETICDALDNDCSAATPDAPDKDGDGVDICDVGDISNPDGTGIDCDDDDPLNFPGNPEVCDGQDNDCDATVDEDFPVLTWYRDADVDGYGDPAITLDTCDGNNQGYVADNNDCDDANPDVHPGALEICDMVDNDCDGTADDETGTRFVATTGSDTDNTCIDSLSPCASINHALFVACDAETISLAEGSYTENIVLDRPISVEASGALSNTRLYGTGGDIVSILSDDVVFDGIGVFGSGNETCIRIGDSSNGGPENVRLRNGAADGCRVGILIDTTTATAGASNRVLSMEVVNGVADGTLEGGVGIVVEGGVADLQIASSLVRNNEGGGILVKSPPTGETNQDITIGNVRVIDNGSGGTAVSLAGIEINDATNVAIEGNEIGRHNGLAGAADGIGVLLSAVDGGSVYCNDVHSNEVGFKFTTGTANISVLHNEFNGQVDTGLLVHLGSDAGVRINESLFLGNATGIDYQGDGTLDAQHSWWGAADGPAPGGTGDSVSGNVDTSNYIARADQPVLVRAPAFSGFDSSTAACYPRIQQATDNSAPGSFLLVGAGTYNENIVATNSVLLEGISGGSGCSPTVINGRQSGGSHEPALRLSGTDGAGVRNFTIRAAGEGTVCGENTGEEIGLDLVNASNTTVEDVCLRANGVSEVRIYGDSDNNILRNLDIDGAIRDAGGFDLCGHRSREGILIDGGPTCEGGTGATADGNQILDSSITFVQRGIKTQLANGTIIDTNSIVPRPAPAWDGGNYSVAIRLEVSNDTQITGNTIQGAEIVDAIRVLGRSNVSCITPTEGTDSAGTIIEDNLIRDASDFGIRLHKGGADPGRPFDTSIECNEITQNGTGVFVQYVGPITGPQNVAHLNDITANSTGLRNVSFDQMPAEQNWWGSSSGPSGSGPGTGDRVFGSVTFSPWLSAAAQQDNDADGFTDCEGDCDDTNDQFNPDQPEVCDFEDNNCDGQIDEGVASIWYRDADEDTYGDPNDELRNCDDVAPAGYVADSTDCNDADPQIHPNAPEVQCDGIDQDCANGDSTPDADQDGYDVCGTADANNPDGLEADCDDGDDQSYPGAPEIVCDGIDQSCSGGDSTPDGDSDGFDVCGPADANNPDGLEADCDDGNDQINPGAVDVACDAIDQDCTGGDSTPDIDSDGYDICGPLDANNPDGLEADCDDNNGGINPGQSEIFCDAIDQDCDGSDSTPDADADGFDVCGPTDATNPDGLDADCDDDNGAINPSATEICDDNLDNDCDGSVDGAGGPCADLEVSGLRFSASDKNILEWNMAPNASSYALYRGEIPATGFASYSHVCEASEISGLTATDPDLPALGEVLYYLATGLDTTGANVSAGSLGTDGNGATRPDSSTMTCGARIYVDPLAAGLGTGENWTDAYTSISAALGHTGGAGRALEIWVTGSLTDPNTSLDGASRSGARILGGFVGTEINAWERSPATQDTTWQGDGATPLITTTRADLTLDGLTLSTATSAVVATADGDRIEIDDVSSDQLSGWGVDLSTDGPSGAILVVRRSRLAGSGEGNIRARALAGTVSGTISSNTLDGGTDAAVHLEANADTSDARISTSVIANSIIGGINGLRLLAKLDDQALSAITDSFVASNTIAKSSGAAVLIEANGTFSTIGGAATCDATPVLVGNTISDAGAAGVVHRAIRSDTTGNEIEHTVRAAAELWDNLITFHAGAGVEESADDPATNLSADPLMIGNGFFGNASLYQDEGASSLPSTADLNALDGNADNFEDDPLFTNRFGDNYHLLSGSSAIDRGHADATRLPSLDIDGEARGRDGDGDGTAAHDVGADEFTEIALGTAELSLSILDAPDPVVAGTTLSYTLRVDNAGPDAATNVVVNDSLPPGVAFDSTTGCTNDPGGSPTCRLGDIPAGSFAEYTLNVIVDSSTADASLLTLSATVYADSQDGNSADDTATEDTTVSTEADLSIASTDDADPVVAGTQLIYTNRVDNAGPSDAQAVIASDTLPAGVTLVSTSGCSEDPDAVPTCSLGIVPAGGFVEYTITVDVDPSLADGTVLTNNVSVTSSTTDTNATNDSSSETTDVGTEANLSVTKVDDVDPVAAGDYVVYTIQVDNAGPSDAANVVATDTLPLPFVFDTTTGCAEDPSGYPNCTLGTIPVGGSAQYTVRTRVKAGAAPGTVTNQVSVTSDAVDPDTLDNSASEDTSIFASADLSVTVTDDVDPVTAGDQLTYTIRVDNAGPSNALTVVVTDTIPAGTTFVSTTGCSEDPNGQPDCTLGTIPAGSFAEYTLTVSVNSDLADGTILTNQATVSAFTDDPDTANNTATQDTTVNAEADLSVTSTDDVDPVTAGSQLVYTNRVDNLGPSDALAVVVTDTLPTGVTLVSTSGCTEDPSAVPTCTLGDIPAGGFAEYTITVTVDADVADGTILTNSVSVSSSTTDTNAANDSATQDTTVNTEADLSITKVDDVDPVAPGGVIVYTIEVSNAGPSDAAGVVVTDTLPAGVVLDSTAGCSEDPNGVPTCTLGTIAAGGVAQYTITVNVDVGASGTLTNNADVSATTFDPNMADNSTFEDTAVQ